MKWFPLLLMASIWIYEPRMLSATQVGDTPGASGLTQESSDLIVTRSADGTEIHGYSVSKGTWEQLTLPKSERFEWDVSGPLAFVRAGDLLAAFSADTGGWDVLQLSKDSRAEVTAHVSVLKIEDGGHLYTFSTTTGLWTSPTDTRLKTALKTLPDVTITPQALETFTRWLSSLPTYQKITLTQTPEAVCLRANRQEYLVMAENKLWELISPDNPRSSAPEAPMFFPPDLPVATAPAASPRGNLFAPTDELQRMNIAIDSLKRDAMHRESMLKVLAQGKNLEDPEVLNLLHDSTAEAFDARQRWYQKEAERLELRLRKIRAEVARRQEARAQIIDQQVEKLSRLPAQPADTESPSGTQPAKASSDLESLFGRPASLSVSGPGSSPVDTNSISPARSPGDFALALRKAREDVDSRAKECEAADAEVQRYSQPLETLKMDVTLKQGITEEDVRRSLEESRRKLSDAQERLSFARKTWQLVCEEYDSQVRLFDSERESAKISYEQSRAQFDASRQQSEAGLIPQTELLSREAQMRIREQELIRAEECMKLYLLLRAQLPELFPPSANPEPEGPKIPAREETPQE